MNKSFFSFTIIGLSLLSLNGCIPESTSGVSTWLHHDRRSSGTIVDDQAIAIKANLAIAKNKKIWQESHISTLTYNSSLLLVGQTKSTSNKNFIEKAVQPISEIANIYNQITVAEPISLKARANDTWLTTQVKARLIASRDIGINRVKVITEDSVVYLMGKLTSDEESIALDLTRRIPGVKKVVAVLERSE